MKISIDIDEETLVPKILADDVKRFEQDLEDYKSGNRFIAIFDIDPKKDKKEIKKHIKAFKRVMKYYSIPGDFIDAAIVAEVGIWGEENLHDHVDTVTKSTNPMQNPHKHKENT